MHDLGGIFAREGLHREPRAQRFMGGRAEGPQQIFRPVHEAPGERLESGPRLVEPPALDLARLHGSYAHDGRPIRESDPRPSIAVFPQTSGSGRLRFEPELTTPLTPFALRALQRADLVAEGVASTGSPTEFVATILNLSASLITTVVPSRSVKKTYPPAAIGEAYVDVTPGILFVI